MMPVTNNPSIVEIADVQAFDAFMAGSPILGKIDDTKTMAKMVASYHERLNTSHNRCLDLSKWLPASRNIIRPLLPADFVVIMADTGGGKTAVLQSIAYYAARPLPTMFFEIELSDDLMCERMLSMHSGKPAYLIEREIKDGKLPSLDGRFDHLFFNTTSSISLPDIQATVMKHNEAHEAPIAVVIVDYIGLIKAEGSRYERFSNIAEDLKRMAKILDAVLIVSCQVRRESGEASSPVHLHAAKESGSIENSAGLVLGVWREGDLGQDMKIKVLKNTRGVTGNIIDAKFDGATMRVTPDFGVDFAHNKITSNKSIK